MVDLVFPVLGEMLPVDHNFELYGAISRLNPWFHETDCPARFAPITGRPVRDGLISLGRGSFLRFRLPENYIRQVLVFAGQRLEMKTYAVRLGVPKVVPLVPVKTLWSPLVTYRNAQAAENLLEHVRQDLADLEIHGKPEIPLIRSGDRAGEARRRIVRVHGRRIIGYSLVIDDLTADGSIVLQERGLGGRRHIGCGFLLPHHHETIV